MANKLELQRALGREVAAYFTRRPEVGFIGFAGVGRHGGALRLEEKDAGGQLSRKLVVKYSLGAFSGDRYSDADEDLRNEYYWLERLRNAEHIVQLVPFADTSVNVPGISRGDENYEELLRRAKRRAEEEGSEEPADFGPPSVLQCPTFALEYLPNGQLRTFVDRLSYDFRQYAPNRILWRIWLCMVRQCVAMAFPPSQPTSTDTGQKIREVIREGEKYCTLTQNSPHIENWIFGDLQPSPDADLIDFGRGRLRDPSEYVETMGVENAPECGSRINLRYHATAMTEVCLPDCNRRQLQPARRPSTYNYTRNGQQFEVRTVASSYLRLTDDLDLELRDILVRCLADRFEDVPPLKEVLEITEAAVANRGPNDNPELAVRMGVREDDDYIKEFIQRVIFEA
ncbi:hypothetical protein EKO27_g5574 [Xylaria grammica]|uniref:Protein kinase domain-containing protein n=1 Tax=Xylaria grammica TaxID=363999 RepID=A0A439D534_9PEZI|nr:hypothetical protein EKO27_g5574 [Xylaria grammica]